MKLWYEFWCQGWRVNSNVLHLLLHTCLLTHLLSHWGISPNLLTCVKKIWKHGLLWDFPINIFKILNLPPSKEGLKGFKGKFFIFFYFDAMVLNLKLNIWMITLRLTKSKVILKFFIFPLVLEIKRLFYHVC